jgi:molybdopterin-guanine dinucleotide biosynthesis protein A
MDICTCSESMNTYSDSTDIYSEIINTYSAGAADADMSTHGADMGDADINTHGADMGDADMSTRGAGTAGSLSGIVLCGGRSRRMGTDKALLRLNGASFLELQIDKLRSLGLNDILLSGPGYLQDGGGVRHIEDEATDCGPLGGMYSCFHAAAHDYALVVAVDSPLISAVTLRRLMAVWTSDVSGGSCHTDAWILTHDSEAQPLLGIYRCGLHSRLSTLIQERKLAVRGFLKTISCKYVELPTAADELMNCNTPEDYDHVRSNPVRNNPARNKPARK